MPSIETYRKQAKQLIRWHREHNYSIGEKVRLLGRYRDLTDAEVLAMAMPLALAQEIVAVEAGFRDCAALKAGASDLERRSRIETKGPLLAGAVPILFVCNALRRPRRPTRKRSASRSIFFTERRRFTVRYRAIAHAFICASYTNQIL